MLEKNFIEKVIDKFGGRISASRKGYLIDEEENKVYYYTTVLYIEFTKNFFIGEETDYTFLTKNEILNLEDTIIITFNRENSYGNFLNLIILDKEGEPILEGDYSNIIYKTSFAVITYDKKGEEENLSVYLDKEEWEEGFVRSKEINRYSV